jgi:hypothetical protein
MLFFAMYWAKYQIQLYLTLAAMTWAYNIAPSFIAPGSCPVEVHIPVLLRLNVTQQEQATAWYINSTNGTTNTNLYQFSWDPTQMPFVVEEGKQLLVG